MVARSHLIVAGIGTVALLGMAGTAIWVALPSDSGEELVRRAQAAPQAAPTVQPKATPVDPPAAKEASATSVPDRERAQAGSKPVEKTAEASAQAIANAEDPNVAPLDPANPRWVEEAAAKAAKPKAANVAAVEEPTDDLASPDILNAYADDAAGADEAATSAIPSAKPVQDAQDDKPAKKQASGRQGQTSRAVTMRARPSSRGGVLGTVPGRTAVQVVSCDRWCEIIYKGKRGFVYRSFLRNNGR